MMLPVRAVVRPASSCPLAFWPISPYRFVAAQAISVPFWVDPPPQVFHLPSFLL
ncbi:hypothetical protein JB92DRAFT_2856826 [Gautieria morchelliformis]|nr:hypothetical protein JB92DRAFT_2856826 [Gautieria morchelliformis]